jgi:CHAT domain-containing protein
MVEIKTRILFDGTDGFSRIGGVRETNAERQLNLVIEEHGNAHRLSVVTTDPELVEAFGEHTECVLPVTRSQVRSEAQICRSTWREHVVDRKTQHGLVFQRYWNFQDAPSHLDAVLPRLAEAGQRLFLAIFRPSDDDDSPNAAVQRHIFDVLRSFSPTRRLRIKITSDTFFAPWNMVYTGAVHGEPISKEQFWGYQHVIEHVPKRSGTQANELDQQPRPLQLGVYVDTEIDRTLKVDCLAPVMKQLDTYAPAGLLRVQREHKDKLKEVLVGPRDDHILYFCCHAEQEGDGDLRDKPSRLRLTDPTDDGWITPSDIRSWMDVRSLCRHPLVFLNACGGGQFTSTFYSGFGDTFLQKGACSVIGPQTDLPAIVGGEFATRFFTRFFQGGPANRIADILAEERRLLFDNHHNPLGLLYSLYRGGDVFLHKALAS